MKKLLMTTSVIAALAGSQMGFSECIDSGNPNATAASCDSTVSLSVANLVVIKGLDDYDFAGAPGWSGTAAVGDNSVILGDLCVGTNNAATGVDVTISSTGGFAVNGGAAPPVPYNVYFDGSGTPAVDGTAIPLTGGNLDNLVCANQGFDLDLEFTGAALLTAVGGVSYTDLLTVRVEPN